MSPKKQEKIFDVKYAKELLKIAQQDLLSAKILKESSSGRVENTLFMAQQSIEKGLKALLVSQRVPVPLVHDLGVLLAKIPDELDPPYGYELNDLNQYASIRRYIEGEYQVTPEDVEIVLHKAEEMLRWCSQQVGETS